MNTVAFGSICKLQNGRAFKPSDWSDSGDPIIRIQNLNDDSKPFNYCNFEVDKKFHINSGDLLFSWSGTPGTSFGAFFWRRGFGLLNQHIFKVTVDDNAISKDYLRYAINSKLHEIIEQAHGGVGLKHITKGKLEAIQIPLPPLEEQKRIAAILDKADAIRQKRKQAIALADEFLRSVFLDMFGDPVSNPKGWEVKPLSELIMKGDKINYGIVQPGDHVEDGIPIVRVGDIKDGSIDKSKLKRVARIIDEKHSKSRLVGDEILITCVGATVGKVALADASLSGFNTVRALTRVRLNEEVNRSFVFRYLQSPFIQGYFQSQLRTVGQPTLNGKQIGETPILLPNLNMQREFLQLSDRALTIKDLSNSQLIEADNMFNSLSQKAFSGQL
ncbi:restriction endonuclease subunit S [Vibrio campbellii]|uniref:restriction endonuclease subunit S n=1 Tax=Vibrio campbellii TaxID=680 RepID=UPI003857DCA5